MKIGWPGGGGAGDSTRASPFASGAGVGWISSESTTDAASPIPARTLVTTAARVFSPRSCSGSDDTSARRCSRSVRSDARRDSICRVSIAASRRYAVSTA